jgi:hypothetical protein
MGQLQLLLEQANQALGRLDGFTSVLPDLSLFLYAYVRKEALLSSQIEGTQSSLSDLLLFENREAPGVSNPGCSRRIQLRRCAKPWYAQTARRVSTFAQTPS